MPPVTTSRRSRGAKPRSLILPVLVVAGLVLVALVAYRLGSGDKSQSQADPKAETSRVDSSPTLDPGASAAASDSSKGTSSKTASAASSTSPSSADTPIATTNGSAPADAELTKKQKWEIAESNRLAKSEAILRAMIPKTHFDNEVENTLERVSKSGALFMQVPQVDMPHEKVLEYLRRPVDIYDDDDDETVAAKERVAEFKTAALKFIEEGGTINQFIRDCAAANKENHETIEEIKREKRRIMLAEGEEAAQAYLDGVNPQLKEAGLPEITINKVDRRALKRKLEAEAATR